MKKVISFLLCFILLFLIGCKKETKSPKKATAETQKNVNTVPSQTINLLYSYGDGFNPYTAKTEFNRKLCLLLYDTLFKVTDTFEYECILAQAVELEGKKCTVRLKDVAFSDGTPLTADDVIYSYNKAKSSETGGYAQNFYEVTSLSKSDDKTLVFYLNRSDPFFVNLLTFPIIKAKSDGSTDSDGVEIPPIGCGRFILGDDKKSFVYNPNYYGKIGSISKIYLLDAPDSESVSHYVEVGACDIYYTDKTDDGIVRMSGKRKDVNINQLVYIGVNGAYPSLDIKEVRYAISSAIDRSEIVSSAYYNGATVAKGFFNPALGITKPANSLEEKANTQITVENLRKMGYNDKNADGYYVNSFGNHLSYTLLVNEDNPSRVRAAEFIAKECKAAGIEIIVIKCPYDQYLNCLYTGNYQLYLGETRILPNMDYSPLAAVGGSVSFGVTLKEGEVPVINNAFDAFYSEQITALELAGTLLSEMPQIPVCYKNGLLFYTAKIKDGVKTSLSDVYYSVNDYIF